jgi:chemotaxis protein methyltransferase CheR
MRDSDCVNFLQWAAPRLRLRWAGLRRVRRQVCKRIARRMRELGLADEAAYRSHLEAHPQEWSRLDAFFRIPISRFHRDRRVFERLREEVLPALAERARSDGDGRVRVWSAGCASGEEPYTLALIWEFSVRPRVPGASLHVLATDADEHLLARAWDGVYAASSLVDLPNAWRAQAFRPCDGRFRIEPRFRQSIELRREDIRAVRPEGPFHLILCRNLVFTYFEQPLQCELLPSLVRRLLPGGALVLGLHESLPTGDWGLAAQLPQLPIFRRVESGSA